MVAYCWLIVIVIVCVCVCVVHMGYILLHNDVFGWRIVFKQAMCVLYAVIYIHLQWSSSYTAKPNWMKYRHSILPVSTRTHTHTHTQQLRTLASGPKILRKVIATLSQNTHFPYEQLRKMCVLL